jgi:hypothetical protein
LRRGIYPAAPFLLAATRKNQPNQMFWVIKNGVEMTGMAAFGKEDDGSTDLEPRRIPAEGSWHFGCGLYQAPGELNHRKVTFCE